MNPLSTARLAFIGCGVMAEAIIAGLLQISRGRAVEPAAAISRLATAVTERVSRAMAS